MQYTPHLFFAIYFITTGMTTFAPKFYGEIGLADSQIGMISASMALLSLAVQPIWGMLADRARYKRTVLAASLVVAGLLCFLVLPASKRFLPLLAVLTLYSAFCTPAIPIASAISIEYTEAHGRTFGPVRMMGTIGYQVAILVTGFALSRSLHSLYPAMGALLLLTAISALMLPPIQGHQHDHEKVSYAVFFKDKALILMFTVAFLSNIGHQFNLTFFSKHLGDLGFSNRLTGIINTCSVMLEIPFLLFGDRIFKRFSIWTWMTIGLVVGAVRYVLVAVLRAPVWIVLAQSLSITQLACFEFFPQVYLGHITRKELLASVQSLYQMITFGIARIFAALLGGFLADAAGIPAMYALSGVLMALTAIAFFVPMRKQARADRG